MFRIMNPDEGTIDLETTPTAIDPESLGSHDAVVTALASHHEHQSHQTQQMWIGDLGNGVSAMFDLCVGDIQRLYDVKTLDTLISIDTNRYTPWRRAGYEVWIVVPAARLSAVHRRLGDNVDRIQGWEIEGTKVKFADIEKF
jgi:hypothetical protein